MPPSRPRGRGDPSTDPIAYVTAAAVIRDEAATWDAKPWNRFGQGPVHMHRQANGPETWRKLAWSRMVAWNTRLFHKEETPENILSQMRQVAETWERQASLHPPPDLSPDEVRRLEAIEARTPLTPAAPIANAFARLEANLLFEVDPNPIIKPRYALELDGLAKRLIPLIETGDPGLAPQTNRRSERHRAIRRTGTEYDR